MRPEERAFLEAARVGYLATADSDGQPHVVPICFALVGPSETPRLVSPIDAKPKSTQDLQRVRDIRGNPRVTLLVDRYSEEWSRLAWVQVRGRASLRSPDEPGHETAVAALESKYDQYADHPLSERPVIEIRVGRTLSWGSTDDYDSTAV